MDKTLRAARERYFWQKMRQDIRQHVQACQLCARAKASKPLAHPKPKPRLQSHPWDSVAIDLMGGYPRTPRGKKHILVVTDLFSRWVEAFAIPNAEIKSIAPVLEQQVFMRFGYPRTLLTDNTPQFSGQQWKKKGEEWGVKAHTTPAYHPQANPTERRNQEIKKGLRLTLADKPQHLWDKFLPEILFAIRSRENAATGQTPSQLLLGRNLTQPGERSAKFSPETQRRVNAAREKQGRYTTLNDESEQKPLQPGEWVYIRNFKLSNADEKYNAGLATPWTGPYQVTARIGEYVYEVDRRESGWIKLSASKIKRMIDAETKAWNALSEDNAAANDSDSRASHDVILTQQAHDRVATTSMTKQTAPASTPPCTKQRVTTHTIDCPGAQQSTSTASCQETQRTSTTKAHYAPIMTSCQQTPWNNTMLSTQSIPATNDQGIINPYETATITYEMYRPRKLGRPTIFEAARRAIARRTAYGPPPPWENYSRITSVGKRRAENRLHHGNSSHDGK